MCLSILNYSLYSFTLPHIRLFIYLYPCLFIRGKHSLIWFYVLSLVSVFLFVVYFFSSRLLSFVLILLSSIHKFSLGLCVCPCSFTLPIYFDVPTSRPRRDMVIRSQFCTYLASATMFNFGLRSVNVVASTQRSIQHAIRTVDVAFEVSVSGWVSSAELVTWMQEQRKHSSLPQTLTRVLRARLFFHSSIVWLVPRSLLGDGPLQRPDT